MQNCVSWFRVLRKVATVCTRQRALKQGEVEKVHKAGCPAGQLDLGNRIAIYFYKMKDKYWKLYLPDRSKSWIQFPG